MDIRLKKFLAVCMLSVLVMQAALLHESLTAYADSTGKVTIYALNLRKSASTDSDILAVLYEGDSVTITGTSGDWYKVNAVVSGNTVTGYVFADYIAKSGTSTTPPPVPQPEKVVDSMTGKVCVNATNMRSGATTLSRLVAVLTRDKKVMIYNEDDTWYFVKAVIDGKTVYGYVKKTHIQKVGSGSFEEIKDTHSYRAGIVDTAVLNVRKTASASGALLGTLTEGTVVKITKILTDWYQIEYKYNGSTILAYVASAYVRTGMKVVTNETEGEAAHTGKPEATPIGKVGRINVYSLNVRKGPGTSYEIVGFLYEDHQVTILDEQAGWYEISTLVNGKPLKGYVLAEFVRLISGTDEPSDADFETAIKAFPATYRPGLRALHKQHPNWKFTPFKTGLDWNDAVNQECKFGVCTIESDMYKNTNFGMLSTASGAYDWSTDTYTVCDGNSWYSASKAAVEYYMDPRNFLEEKYIFCFEMLGYSSTQKVSVVQSMLAGTFMSGNYTETDPSTGSTYTKSYAQTFMDAGKIAGANPYFLAARSYGENGAKGSGQTSGNYGAYSGYYNFYSIGATDGGDAQAKGLQYAMSKNTTYMLPWNTRYKAILGGAKFIAAEYISVGQNTPYFQKFNVSNKDSLYWHQYMTSANGACYTAAMSYNTYKANGVLNQALEFLIPVYSHMPAETCQKPSASNPNPYLKSLNINGGGLKLTPSFKYNVTDYTLVVPYTVNSISVSAIPVSRFAENVTGTGNYNLAPGVTRTISVTCTAGDGTTKTYNVKVYRQT